MANGKQFTAYVVTIDSNNAGQRLDNYLIKHLKGVPKGHLYRIVRKGEVRVNKRRCRVHQRLEEGDQVRIPPLRTSHRALALPMKSSMDAVLNAIIYEDEHLIALNKPARWAVHGGSGNKNGIIETLKLAKPNSPFIELAHRLDKETSGCLLIAKSRRALLLLQQMFKSHDGQIVKHYKAMLKGNWDKGSLTIEAGLSVYMSAENAKSVQIDQAGKSAITLFKPEKLFTDLSLMDINIKTGRMHQIRVHCAHLGYPVAGDGKYGDFEFNRRLKKQYRLDRMFLHACQLEFIHPLTNRRLTIQAPLADDLAHTLKLIENEQV